MSILFDASLVALHSQHSIQSQDLWEICACAHDEGVDDNFSTYSFDDFLGLTVHLFITTQAQQVRQQLALKLHKFGSAIVSPLIKTLHQMQTQEEIQLLVQQSLDRLAPHALIIGLSQLLEHEIDNTFRTTAMQRLMDLIHAGDQTVLLVLPKLVSTKTWRLVKLQQLQEIPYPIFNKGYQNQVFSPQISDPIIQNQQSCSTEKKNDSDNKFNLCRVK
ncbi:hypothetical protein D0962_05830 [Leptolyngbyaceae cyanobacterium CCMR0082]|uniref:Uncharacterized protein n=1 Tax=Adonisia turfae CCMR0082 TaxID=2304604 RepID=A0A6M0S1E5_9CYAN|nr:hypothetical protein [Adonisia turfae]MDV3353358.1 hypothetical protein [Leptothoe sp. LEGE 181152]NEZ62299.1 hypothetical protein [Adonisia turfae CCMR0082]